MKLHKVRLENLNSLYGEHVIDFENDLFGAPLFLILGQTGAGKSTILDAICLALFGQTPRLSKVTGRPETEPRLIMSHGTSTCLAEIEFSRLGSDGTRKKYRATWTCRRSRGRADGNLQEPERSLTLLEENGMEELLVSDKRKKYYLPVFQEHLESIEVEDFQRSVLLAQGEFAAFLRADQKEKASILERLTSTDMYKRIGQRAAGRKREAKKALEGLEQRLENLDILEENEERELRDSLAQLEGEVETDRQQLTGIQETLQWLDVHASHLASLRQTETTFANVQEALKSRADDIALLQEDDRCRPVAPLLNEVLGLQRDCDEIKQTLPALEKEESELHQRVTKLTSDRESAEAVLVEARGNKEKAQDRLEEAQAIQAQIDAQRHELSQRTLERSRLGEALQESKKRCKVLEDGVSTHKNELTKWSKQREDLAYAEPLVSELTGLSVEVEHLSELQERRVEAAREVDAIEAKCTSLSKQLKQNEASLSEAEEAIAPFEARLEKAKAQRDNLLEGARDLRSRRDTLEEKRQTIQDTLHHIEDAIRGHEELVEIVSEVTQSKQSCQELEWELQELRPQVELKRHDAERKESTFELLSDSLRIAERHLALRDERDELQPEQPCPLCGSLEHPYLEGGERLASEERFLQQRKQVKEEMADLKAESKRLRAEVLELEKQITRKDASKQSLEKKCATLDDKRSRKEGGWFDSVNRLPFVETSLSEPFPEEEEKQKELWALLQDRKEGLGFERYELVDKLRVIDDLRDELTKSTEELEQARKSLEESILEGSKLREHLALRQEEWETWKSKLVASEEKWQAETEVVRAKLAAFRIQIDEQSDWSAYAKGIEEATDLRKSFEQVQQKTTRIESELREAEKQLETARQSASQQEEQHTRLTEEETERSSALVRLEEEQKEMLGGEVLHQMRERLDSAIQAADMRLIHARDRLSEAREHHSRVKALLDEKRASLEAKDKQYEVVHSQLLGECTSLQLASIEELRASLLPDDRKRALANELKEMREQLEHAQFQLTSTQDMLAEHERKKPDVLVDGVEQEEEWRVRQKQLQVAIDEKHETIGVKREKVKRHEEATARASEVTEQLQEAREEYRVWRTIDQLIGVGDGDAFKQFAQSLNLQELVDRANARLLRLNPRYQLAVATGESGEPKLDFVIRDRHHADHERPLTTLSGGETFLVSLALALALADFRRIAMPIETLLLDEGFGTLDQDTLDVAMSTLRQLQQESEQQIGLISHVEMLKERIDTRIIVEKIGNGRSTLFVEGIPVSPVVNELTSAAEEGA
jgi:exonuclease SbcC